jgi:hypothetical protein
MKSTLATALAALVLSGTAFAGNTPANDSFRIHSEAQFLNDYGDQVESIGPGVYQVVKGKLAGKVIAIGEAGLAYDLAEHRSRADRPQIGTGKGPLLRGGKAGGNDTVRRLEAVQARYAERARTLGTEAGTKASSYGGFSCRAWAPNGFIWYGGWASVSATTGLYMDRGDGSLNWYYSRARAFADGYVTNVPFGAGVFPNPYIDAYAKVENVLTGQIVQRTYYGRYSATANTDYIYNGPSFSHNMRAFAYVQGLADCIGYVSISDAFTL